MLLAGCTKFHFPEPVLPEAPAESAPKQEVPEPFTPEELGEIVSANLIENVDVDMSEEGIRFTWIEDEPREPAQYWILVSTDGEEFEPIHTFHTDEAAHISTLSTFMTFSVNPEDDADVLELLQGILSAGYERHETPIIDPVSGQLHLPPSLFDNYEMDPADVESIIQQMQNHPERTAELLAAFWPKPGEHTPPPEFDEAERAQAAEYITFLLASFPLERPDFERPDRPDDYPHEQAEHARELLQKALDERKDQMDQRNEELDARRAVALDRAAENAFILDTFMQENTNHALSGSLVSLKVNDSFTVRAEPTRLVRRPVSYTPTIIGSLLFYSPSSLGSTHSSFHLSGKVPGYAVVTDRNNPYSPAAFVVCVRDPDLFQSGWEDTGIVPSCHGAIEERRLGLIELRDETGDIWLSFLHEYPLSEDPDEPFDIRISTVLPGETAQFAESEDDAFESVLRHSVSSGGFVQSFFVRPGEREPDHPIIIAIEIFAEGIQKPVFWDVYELDVNNLPAQ